MLGPVRFFVPSRTLAVSALAALSSLTTRLKALPLLLLACCDNLVSMPAANRSETPSMDSDIVESSQPVIHFDPEPTKHGVAPIVQLQITGIRADESHSAQPSIYLVQGSISAAQIRNLANHQIGDAIQKRLVDIELFEIDSQSILVIPQQSLELGARYSVIVAQQLWADSFFVMPHDDHAVIRMVWPNQPVASQRFVWCEQLPDDGIVDETPQPFELYPGVKGTLRHGAVQGLGARCVHWQPDAYDDANHRTGSSTETIIRVTPPTILPLADGSSARVVPSRMQVQLSAQHEPLTDPTCDSRHIQAGPVCAWVMDDRVQIVSTEPYFVGLTLMDQQQVFAIDPQHKGEIRNLPPSSQLSATLYGISLSGQLFTVPVHWHTTPPVARVIINEVMANPVGPEPQQEWVELYNDGTKGIDLSGWQLQDSTGHVKLPQVSLQPRQYALIVGHNYDPDCWLDKPPQPTTMLIRVPQVASGGISNSGEPLRLVDTQAQKVSQVIAMASKLAGTSIARISPSAEDNDPSSFRLHPDGGTPGADNAIAQHQ